MLLAFTSFPSKRATCLLPGTEFRSQLVLGLQWAVLGSFSLPLVSAPLPEDKPRTISSHARSSHCFGYYVPSDLALRVCWLFGLLLPKVESITPVLEEPADLVLIMAFGARQRDNRRECTCLACSQPRFEICQKGPLNTKPGVT